MRFRLCTHCLNLTLDIGGYAAVCSIIMVGRGRCQSTVDFQLAFRNDGGESFDSHNDGCMGQGGGKRNYFFYGRLNIKEVVIEHEECLWLLDKELRDDL